MKIPFYGLSKQYNRLRIEVLDTIDLVLRSGQLMATTQKNLNHG